MGHTYIVAVFEMALGKLNIYLGDELVTSHGLVITFSPALLITAAQNIVAQP